MDGVHDESMLAYSTYSEAGGVGKTKTAANLAVAHARAGLKFLDIGIQARERLPIVAASRLELESLAEKTGETVWLFTEEHGQCV